MTDREKVIRGLESLETRLVECGDKLDASVVQNAIALLKEQEARVMTLEEVNALDFDYFYLEQERLPGKVYRGMLGKYIMTCETWHSITAAKISQGVDNYGKTWRCWTSRPTDEQREAEPWEN